MEHEQRQQRSLLQPAEGEVSAVAARLDRPEDPELETARRRAVIHVPRVSGVVPGNPRARICYLT